MSFLTPVDYREIPPGNNLLQSRFWGDFKSRFGWKPSGFIYNEREESSFGTRGILLLERNLPGGFTLGYLPHPLKDLSPADLPAPGLLLSDMKPLLPRRTICLRCDLSWEIPDEGEGTVEEPVFFRGLKKAVMDIQPPSTVLISLEGDEENLLKGMKSKTRYNIRLAFRRGVEVREEKKDFLSSWYELYRETARRDRITIHSPGYYRGLFEAAESLPSGAPELRIFSAYHEGTLLASVIIALYGNTATYLYGASSNEKRNLMASYAVQWEAMKAAAAAGCEIYDLFGIPPADDPEHPMHGLYRFKTGFGGRILHRPGAWDLPVFPIVYDAFRSLEKVRYFYYKKLKKH